MNCQEEVLVHALVVKELVGASLPYRPLVLDFRILPLARDKTSRDVSHLRIRKHGSECAGFPWIAGGAPKPRFVYLILRLPNLSKQEVSYRVEYSNSFRVPTSLATSIFVMPKLWGQRCGVDQLGRTVGITAGCTVGAQYKFSVGLER